MRRRELGQATNGDGQLAENEVEPRKQGAEMEIREEMEKMEKMETYKRRSLDVKLAEKALGSGSSNIVSCSLDILVPNRRCSKAVV